LCDERKDQALILARVSRSFNLVATRLIYRSVTYWVYPDRADKEIDLNLLHRLLDDHILRSHVCSFTVDGSSKWSFKPEDYAKKLDPIVRLVSVLPRLQTFKLVKIKIKKTSVSVYL
jgi:hypothetical protein